MVYDKLQVPADGKKITVNPDFSLNVPAHPIIPFIEGDSTGVDITPVMRKVVDAAVAKAIQYAINNDKSSVTLVHKGNIMKFTEDAFREWGYALAQNEFGTQLIDKGPWCKFNNPKTNREIVVKDVIADAIQAKTVIYDFARLMDGAQELSCSAFGEAMISHM